jgi:hypothetical protein
MSESTTRDPVIPSTTIIAVGRVITWAVPIMLWLIHMFVIVPLLNARSGDAQFLMALQFFQVSGLLMIICFGLSLGLYLRSQSRADLIPLLLNLSWLYYVKVLFYGPTIGNL